MALSVNQHTVIGNLGKDPEIRNTKSGTLVANFSVATTRKTKTGKETDWHRIVIFGDNLIDKVIRPYVKKGSQVMVQGSSQTRSWDDQAGLKRYKTEIVVSGPGSTITLGQSNDRQQQPTASRDDDFGADVPFDDPLG
jgi:single-strand DNA-binding protein